MEVIEADSIVFRIASHVDNATVTIKSRLWKQFQWQMSEEDTTALDFGLLSLILVIQVESANPPVIILAKLICD
jgi:hypothetical protein